MQTVAVLSDAAVVAARSRLNPTAGVMLSALWVADAGRLVLIIHHLAVDAVSWRILLEDLNIGWAQHRSGQPVALPAGGTSFARWASLLAEHAHASEVVEHAEAWKQVAAAPAALPPVQPEVDTYAGAGHLSVSLDSELTRTLLGAVPAAFHAGIQDILLIAFALSAAEFFGTGGAPIGIDVEGHGRHEELTGDVDLSRTVGWFTTTHPVSLTVGGLSWARVLAGEAALGAVIKNAKEQLRALPDPLTYGSAALPQPRRRPARGRPADRIQLSGPAGGSGAVTSDELWQISPDAASVTAAAAAVPMPLAAHRRTQRRHHRHRGRSALARQLDLGTLSTGSRTGEPVEPVMVRRPRRHLHPRPTRRRRVNPLRCRPARLSQTADRPAAEPIRGSPTSCR